MESLGRGALQGATLGFGDEAAGAITGLMQGGVNLLPKSLARALDVEQAPASDAYAFSRDSERQANAAADKAHGGYYLGGNLVGGALTAPLLPGVAAAKGAGLGARTLAGIANGATQGAAFGLGASNAQLASTDALKDTLTGGLVGGAIGGAAPVVGAGIGKLAGRAKRGAAEAVAAQTEKSAAAKAAEIARQSGQIGRDTATTFQTFERYQQILNDPNAPQRLKDGAQASLNDPRFKAALLKAQEEYVRKGPELLSAIESGYAKLDDARAMDVAKDAAEKLANPIQTQVVPRLKMYASRALPMAVGSAIGGPAGMVAGTAVAGALGRPGTALANAMKSPALRKLAWESVDAVASAPERLAQLPLARRLGNPAGAEAESLRPLLPPGLRPTPAMTEKERRLKEQQLMAEALLRR
jgi:hypothetical protein